IHAAKRRYQRGSERCVAIVIKLQYSMDDSKKICRPHNGRSERHGTRDHIASASAWITWPESIKLYFQGPGTSLATNSQNALIARWLRRYPSRRGSPRLRAAGNDPSGATCSDDA